jgi:DNA-binding NtrC family response regulator
VVGSLYFENYERVLTHIIEVNMSEEITEMLVDVEEKSKDKKAGRPKRDLDMNLIVSAHEGGYSAKEIVDLLHGEGIDVCAATVRSRLKKAGHKLSRGARKSDITEDEIKALYIDQELNLSDTAHELGVSVVTLRARMKEFDIEVRKRGRKPSAPNADNEVTASSEAV